MTKYKSRIFITGDTHCSIDIHKLNSNNFPIGSTLTKNDIVIICGDAGFVWSGDDKDQHWIDWIDRKPWTTVYVCGNHENFDLLKKYPVVDFHGAKAHQISHSLYHILRGEIFEINDETFFCFGGAFSHDRECRVENISWWQDELPVQREIDNAITNLNKYNHKVDYIITHDVPTEINMALGYTIPNMNNYDKGKYIHICQFLQNVFETVQYKVWFAGHYHINQLCQHHLQILYHDIVELKKIPECYVTIDSKINKIMSRNYSRLELLKLCQEDNLYMTSRKMDKKENFSQYETIIKVEDFFNVDVTDKELSALTYLYNKYLTEKQTFKE